jgi:tRNA(adenine34) deaminase
LTTKRIAWFEENRNHIVPHLEGSEVEKAYQLILMKIGISEKEAPIVEKTDDRVVFHSVNSCPALDACEILGLDTRVVCRLHTEAATDALIKKLNPKLRFTRNYARLRPDGPFCEEIIELRRNDSQNGLPSLALKAICVSKTVQPSASWISGWFLLFPDSA